MRPLVPHRPDNGLQSQNLSKVCPASETTRFTDVMVSEWASVEGAGLGKIRKISGAMSQERLKKREGKLEGKSRFAIDGWMDGQAKGRTGWMDGQRGQMDGRSEWMNGWVGRLGGWMDEWIDRQTDR